MTLREAEDLLDLGENCGSNARYVSYDGSRWLVIYDEAPPTRGGRRMPWWADLLWTLAASLIAFGVAIIVFALILDDS